MPWKYDLPFREPGDDSTSLRKIVDTQRRCSYCRALLIGDEPNERTTCARHRQLERLRDAVRSGALTDWPETNHLAALGMPRSPGSPTAQTELTQVVTTACYFLKWRPWRS